MMIDLLTSLMTVPRWDITRNIYGSSHNTLIGLLVAGWISIGVPTEQEHRVLEGAPRAFNGRPCDAILVKDQKPVGIAEVEGGSIANYNSAARRRGEAIPNDELRQYFKALDRIGGYFADQAWQTLEFAVYVAYPTELRKDLPIARFVAKGKDLIEQHPTKQLIILVFDREWRTESPGSLFKKPYHDGHFYRVTGSLIYKQNDQSITHTPLTYRSLLGRPDENIHSVSI